MRRLTARLRPLLGFAIAEPKQRVLYYLIDRPTGELIDGHRYPEVLKSDAKTFYIAMRDACMRASEVVFRVVAADGCPCYDEGDEFKLSGNALLLELKQEKTFVSTAIVTPPYEKESCRTLIGDLTRILIEFENVDRIPQKSVTCGGCTGVIEMKARLHHRCNGGADARDRSRNIDAVAAILSNFSIFQALDHQNLREIVALLKFKRFARNEVVLMKGDPAQNLYILLSGAVDVLDEDGVRLSALRKGDVFGEMSLISGEPVGATIKVVEPAKIIFIKGLDFKEILNKFPSIQMYLAKLLAQRLAKSNLTVAEEIASGMLGRLSEMPPAEIFQTLNLNQKTGRLSLILPDGVAEVAFRQGDLVSARYKKNSGKEAFFALMLENEGRFKFHPALSEKEKTAPVMGSFMDLLLEGLRRADERRCGQEHAGQILV
jgi:CRP-like cAMP-binding protein